MKATRNARELNFDTAPPRPTSKKVRPEKMSDRSGISRLIAHAFLSQLLNDSTSEFDGTAASVTRSMREACPLTKEVNRDMELQCNVLEQFGPSALAMYGSSSVTVKVNTLRDEMFQGSAFFKGAGGVIIVLKFGVGRFDAQTSMSKYQLMESEDTFVEQFVQSCMPQFLDPAWPELAELCRMICVEEEFGKVTAFAKIHSKRPTIRVVRSTIADALNVLRSELALLNALDSSMVERRVAAILPIDTRVAQFEVARRAEEARKQAAEQAAKSTKKAKTEPTSAV